MGAVLREDRLDLPLEVGSRSDGRGLRRGQHQYGYRQFQEAG
jgi:hypothetical protein